MKARKKPVVVEVEKLGKDEKSIVKVVNFIAGVKGEDKASFLNKAVVKMAFENGGIFIDTLEGEMKASFGDYIIKGAQGEFYPCKPDIFEQTYEIVEE